MIAFVVAVYFPVPAAPDDNTVYASDYHQLHARRIRFAQDALATQGMLPSWYPRELMGTPFWSNVQSFPFIPTRLVLLALDPLNAMTVGVQMAAVLAAAFTFLFTRRIGMGRVGAATAGWTFACAGFFASRVMAGHLPLLEAYPALPLLLWRVEVCLNEQTGKRQALSLSMLSLAALCVVLAGHPQLPVYALGVAGLYLLYRSRRRRQPVRVMLPSLAAMALGVSCGAFSLWPMFQLIGRSTRVLALRPADNDLAFPYGRLAAFLLPWRDGWPEGALAVKGRVFSGYPNDAYFWDTVCYVGWMPLLAMLFLLGRRLMRRRAAGDEPRAGGPWAFFVVLGVLSLATALPAAHRFTRQLPGTFLRSPARQLYVTTFSLALAAGVGADALRRAAKNARPGLRGQAFHVTLGALLALHVVDLGRHARAFIRMTNMPTERSPAFEQAIRRAVGDGRIALDVGMTLPFNREMDDVGFFDSIMLARPYAALLDLTGAPPDLNIQHMRGSDLSPRALALTGTRLMMTMLRERPDLQLVSGPSRIRTYLVPAPLPRAAFLPSSAVLTLDEAETRRRLRDPAYDVGSHVMLSSDVPPSANAASETPSAAVPAAAPAVAYERPTSDEILVRVRATESGVLRVLESWDPGWRATANGIPVDVRRADYAFLGVALPAGDYEVHLTYSTPGAGTGIGISLASLFILAALLISTARANSPTAPPSILPS